MSTTSSPNMSLPVPTVGQEPGPDYATDINSCLSIVDQHTHNAGSGVQITPTGLNINTSLNMNNNLLTASAGMTLASTATPGINTIYESGVDLYFVDGNGNNVRLTQSGSVAGTSGSISNLVSPASASYVALSGTFVWQSGASIAASMDMGSAVMRNLTLNSFALTLSPPTLANDYTITLPILPASQKFLTLDSLGAMSATWAVDNSTIEVSSNSVRVKDLGITAAKIANTTITAGKIANATITGTQLASNIALPGQAVTAGGQYVVVSNTNPSLHNLAIVQGRFDQTTITSGEGFTVGNPSPGVYNVTFTSAFTSVPSIQVTCENGGARIATVTSVNGSGCTVNTFDTAFAFVQTPVNFLAIGQKA